MLVSPAEPKILRELGTSSALPEQYGADFLIHSPYGLVGIQRKELSDLVASLNDDRLSREIIQLKECDWAIWLIEGIPQFTSDGESMWTRSRYTRSHHHGLMFSLLFQGFSLLSTATITETGLLLSQLEKWLQKEKHNGVNHRKNARGMFGQPDTEEWQIHFLLGLPGLGYERAKAIRSYYDGLPFTLERDLSQVPGVGKKTAERIRRIVNGR